jgi:hypothetical protein
MKLTDYIKKYGARKTAMKLVSDRIFSSFAVIPE